MDDTTINLSGFPRDIILLDTRYFDAIKAIKKKYNHPYKVYLSVKYGTATVTFSTPEETKLHRKKHQWNFKDGTRKHTISCNPARQLIGTVIVYGTPRRDHLRATYAIPDYPFATMGTFYRYGAR